MGKETIWASERLKKRGGFARVSGCSTTRVTGPTWKGICSCCSHMIPLSKPSNLVPTTARRSFREVKGREVKFVRVRFFVVQEVPVVFLLQLPSSREVLNGTCHRARQHSSVLPSACSRHLHAGSVANHFVAVLWHDRLKTQWNLGLLSSSI